MNKFYKWMMLVSLALGVGLFGCQTSKSQVENQAVSKASKSQSDEVEAYRAAVAQFKSVSVEDFKNLIADGKALYAYFGRETCEHCRKFAPELAQQAGVEIVYLNTEDSEDLALKALRKTYQIEYVPSLLKFSAGTYQTYQADKDPLAQFLKLP